MKIFGLNFDTPWEWLQLAFWLIFADIAVTGDLILLHPGGRLWLASHHGLWLLCLAAGDFGVYFWLRLWARIFSRFIKPPE